MAPSSTIVTKLKVQLKLSITRLRMIQQKDAAIAKQQRRAMAQLLEAGKIESARIRVENIIRSDITTELHEILELYCELLLARSGLLEASSTNAASSPSSTASQSSTPAQQCDPGLLEPIHALIYAAPRTEVRELHAVRALLVDRFGKEFASAAAENRPDVSAVPARVLDRLKTDPPPPKLVQSYLEEIARWYDVDWPKGRREREAAEEETAVGEDEAGGNRPAGANGDDEDNDGPDGGGQRIRATEAPLAADLARATPPRDFGPKSPVTVAPPAASTENVSPKVKVPGAGGKSSGKSESRTDGGKASSGAGSAGTAKNVVGGKIPDVDELAARFAALKK